MFSLTNPNESVEPRIQNRKRLQATESGEVSVVCVSIKNSPRRAIS
jgi:hypothetical protein